LVEDGGVCQVVDEGSCEKKYLNLNLNCLCIFGLSRLAVKLQSQEYLYGEKNINMRILSRGKWS